MNAFNHILNWTLHEGSHEFPGPDGGTCINEAALIAAGFEYRSIASAMDMPPCFSRVIAQYALALNDGMPDNQRQRLLSYVTRLAGTADIPDVERQRAEYLAIQAVSVFAAKALDTVCLSEYATKCRAATTLDSARAAADAAARAARAAAGWVAADAAGWAARAAGRAAGRRAAGWAAADAADAAARSARTVARWAAADAAAWDDALVALDGALAIGKQANSPDLAIVAQRLSRAKSAKTVHA